MLMPWVVDGYLNIILDFCNNLRIVGITVSSHSYKISSRVYISLKFRGEFQRRQSSCIPFLPSNSILEIRNKPTLK